MEGTIIYTGITFRTVNVFHGSRKEEASRSWSGHRAIALFLTPPSHAKAYPLSFYDFFFFSFMNFCGGVSVAKIERRNSLWVSSDRTKIKVLSLNLQK